MSSSGDLVNELVELGVLERDDAKRVRVGVRMWEIAARSSRPLDLREAAMPFMEDLQEDLLTRRLERYTEHTPTEPEHLRRVLAQVRREGFAVASRMISAVGTGLAAPVRDRNGDVVAALSVVLPAADANPRVQVPALVAAARGVSRALGAAPPGEDLVRTRATNRFA